MNLALLKGNVGTDPEVRETNGGTSVCNFRMATEYRRGDEKFTTWHNVVAFGGLAEYLGDALHKGDRLMLSGRIENRSYETSDGEKKYISEVVANEVLIGASGGGNGGGGGGGSSAKQEEDDGGW